jgi:acetylornithine deacetylase/succinyl-diaminopimelate desuccinylase-like protein
MNSSSFDPKHLASYVNESRSRFEEMLAAAVEVPTVSMDPERRDDIERGADLACEFLRECGATAKKVPTSGNPVIVGSFPFDPSRPTVNIYNHMDVQPASQEDGWLHPPFRFKREGDRYLGRGTTDDKGPAFAALLAARYAHQNGIPLNIRFVWEMEEEVGSTHFDEFLAQHGGGLETSSILVSDTLWIARGRPAIPYGLRGLQAALLTLETATKDVHSGTTGGVARNPVGELAEVIARCYDPRTGKVKIPGFYKDVKRPSKPELESFWKSGFNLARFKAAHELKKHRKLDAREAMQRIWSMPTFEVHGIVGGYQGPGLKTIVPARAEAKLSMRLVPNMKPKKTLDLLKSFVRKINPDVKVVPEHSAAPFLGEFSGPFADAARQALKFGFNASPSFIREGGTIGAVLSMQQAWKCPVILMGLSLPEHGYHAINENFDWGQASGGIQAFVKYFDLISRVDGGR